jgi:competence protein ComEC
MEDAVRVRTPRSTASVGHAWLPWALPPLLLAAILVWAAVLTAPDGRLHITFLDVGQGDSILIRSPSGRTVLVDGGPDGRNTCAGIDSQLPFWDRSIDALVITHLHVDHLGGLLEVIERYQTNLVLQPATTTATSLVAEEWARRVAVGQPAVVHIQKEHTLDLGDGTVIEVLHPPARPLTGTEDDTDNNGVVLRVSYGEVGVLLTADIRADAERLLVHRCPWQLQASVLKVAHHGSASSSTAQFLAAVTPSIAIVSAGATIATGTRMRPWYAV